MPEHRPGGFNAPPYQRHKAWSCFFSERVSWYSELFFHGFQISDCASRKQAGRERRQLLAPALYLLPGQCCSSSCLCWGSVKRSEPQWASLLLLLSRRREARCRRTPGGFSGDSSSSSWRMANWRYLKHTVGNGFKLLLVAVLVGYGVEKWDEVKAWMDKVAGSTSSKQLVEVSLVGWGAAAALLLLLAGRMVFGKRRDSVYLVDFACYKPHDSRKCSAELMEYIAARFGVYSEKTMEFFRKVYLKAGVGDETYAPPSVFQHPQSDLSWKQARIESEEAIFGAVDEVLAKTGVRPKDISILIVNSSCFTPTPSLSAMVVNHYKMNSDVRTFNLGGMGCSAGLISIDLARDLLGMYPNTYALVVSTENITHNLYLGNYRPMLVTNCLFRVGGAAILLTNKRSVRSRCKYELLHSVRVHNGADDKAYGCIMQETDSDGVLGINLTKHIMVAAAEAMKKNLTKLGPLVLPLSEQAAFAANLIARQVLRMSRVKPYIPDFSLAFDHFLLHAGGRAVVDELQKSLRLNDAAMEPCRMTLYRFGNTSSSCVWYELAYVEAKGDVKWGDRLWQLGLGSGFKCNSVVWKALRDVPVPQRHNPWLDCIQEYPVDVPTDLEDIPRVRDSLKFQTVDGALVLCKTGEIIGHVPPAPSSATSFNVNGAHVNATHLNGSVNGGGMKNGYH